MRQLIETIHAQRLALGWSKRRAADACNMPYFTYVNFELNRRKGIRPHELDALSAGLGLDREELSRAAGY